MIVIYVYFVYRQDSFKEVVAWIKSLPTYRAPKQKIGAEILDECVVRYMEKLLNTHWVTFFYFYVNT